MKKKGYVLYYKTPLCYFDIANILYSNLIFILKINFVMLIQNHIFIHIMILVLNPIYI